MNNDNLTVLSSCFDLRNFDEQAASKKFMEIRNAGYWGIYLSDIFFIQVPPDSVARQDSILFKDPDNWFIERPESELLTIERLLRDAELSISGAHFLQILPDKGQPPETIYSLHERLLNVASFMGIKNLTTHIAWRLHSGFLGVDYNDEELYSDSLAAYGHLCKEAETRGIRIAIETACQSWPWLDENPDRLIAFIKDVGAENLGICLDSGHCHIAGIDIPKAIHTFGDYFWETHFHDNFGRQNAEFSKCDLHNPVGIGTIDWRKLIQAMREIDYSGVITFEQLDFLTNEHNWKLFLKSVKSN